jgi:hypothetical protein
LTPFFAAINPAAGHESMKFPVFSLLAGNFEASETSSLETLSSSGESDANLTSSPGSTTWARSSFGQTQPLGVQFGVFLRGLVGLSGGALQVPLPGVDRYRVKYSGHEQSKHWVFD